MRELNYNHLHYFWTVAREGSISQASEVLHLTPQTISGQIKLLEETVGFPLLQRMGRGVVLTATGHIVKEYADEIFSVGAELVQRVRSEQPGLPATLHVGVVSSMPKLIAYRTLKPVLDSDNPQRVVSSQGTLDTLLSELAIHKLDLVLSDRPVPTGLNVKAYNHELGESAIAFFVSKRLARKYRGKFPRSLHNAPILLPAQTTALRRRLDDWFESMHIAPRIIGEFDDSALLKVFGASGNGIFPAPLTIAQEVEHMCHATQIGSTNDVKEHYVAISPERKLKHPAVVQITQNARQRLFQ